MSTFTRPSIPHPHAPHPHQGRESIFDARVQREEHGLGGLGYAHYARAAQECTEAIDRSVGFLDRLSCLGTGRLMGKCGCAVDNVAEDMSVYYTRTSYRYCAVDEDIGSTTCSFTSPALFTGVKPNLLVPCIDETNTRRCMFSYERTKQNSINASLRTRSSRRYTNY